MFLVRLEAEALAVQAVLGPAAAAAADVIANAVEVAAAAPMGKESLVLQQAALIALL